MAIQSDRVFSIGIPALYFLTFARHAGKETFLEGANGAIRLSYSSNRYSIRSRSNVKDRPRYKRSDVASLSPLGFDHINMLGRYAFILPDLVARGELRPLLNPAIVDDES